MSPQDDTKDGTQAGATTRTDAEAVIVTPSPPSQPLLDYYLEEYKSLRQEMEQRLQEGSSMAQYAVLGSAATIAWLSTASRGSINPYLYALAWWVPFVLCVFCASRGYALLNFIKTLGRYIKALESRFGVEQTLGWEHFIAEKRRTTRSANMTEIVWFVFWSALTAGTFAIGWVAHNATEIQAVESKAEVLQPKHSK